MAPPYIPLPYLTQPLPRQIIMQMKINEHFEKVNIRIDNCLICRRLTAQEGFVLSLCLRFWRKRNDMTIIWKNPSSPKRANTRYNAGKRDITH